MPNLADIQLSMLDLVAVRAQLIDRRLGHALLDDHHAGASHARPERRRKMFGMPRRRVDRLLQIHVGVHVAQEHLRDPLVLLIAARRAPGEIGLAVAQRHGRCQRRTRAFARRERRPAEKAPQA